MDVGGVGDLDDLVGLHHVAADPGYAAVRLVVDPQIAAVIRAVGERHVRMVGIAVVVIERIGDGLSAAALAQEFLG